MKTHLLKWKVLLVIAVSLFSWSSVTAGPTERPLATNENSSKNAEITILKSSDPDKSYVLKRMLAGQPDCYARFITNATNLDLDHLKASILINGAKPAEGIVDKGTNEDRQLADSCFLIVLSRMSGDVNITMPVGSIKDKVTGLSNTKELVYRYRIISDEDPTIFANPVREADILTLESFKISWEVPEDLEVDHYAVYVHTEPMYSQFIDFPNYSADLLVADDIAGDALEYVITGLEKDKNYFFALFGYSPDGYRYFYTGNNPNEPVYIPKEFKLEILSTNIAEKTIINPMFLAEGQGAIIDIFTSSGVKKESIANVKFNAQKIDMNWVSFGENLDQWGFPIGGVNQKHVIITIPEDHLNTGLFSTNSLVIDPNTLQSEGGAFEATGITRNFKVASQDELMEENAIRLFATAETSLEFRVMNSTASQYILTLSSLGEEPFEPVVKKIDATGDSVNVKFEELKAATDYLLRYNIVDEEGYTIDEDARLTMMASTDRGPVALIDASMPKKSLVAPNTDNVFMLKYDGEVTLVAEAKAILQNIATDAKTDIAVEAVEGAKDQLQMIVNAAAADYYLILPIGYVKGENDKPTRVADTFHIRIGDLGAFDKDMFSQSTYDDKKLLIRWNKSKITSYDSAALYTRNYYGQTVYDATFEDGSYNPFFKMKTGWADYTLEKADPKEQDSLIKTGGEKNILGYGMKLYDEDGYQLYPFNFELDTILWRPSVDRVDPGFETRLNVEPGAIKIYFSEEITLIEDSEGDFQLKEVAEAGQVVTLTAEVNPEEETCLVLSYAETLHKNKSYELVFPAGKVQGAKLSNAAYANWDGNYRFKTVSDGAVIDKEALLPDPTFPMASMGEMGAKFVLAWDKNIKYNTESEGISLQVGDMETGGMFEKTLDETCIVLDSISRKIYDENYEEVGIAWIYRATINYNLETKHQILALNIPEGTFTTVSNGIDAEGFTFEYAQVKKMDKVFEELTMEIENKDITSTTFTPTWKALDFDTWDEFSDGGGGVGPLMTSPKAGVGSGGVVNGYQLFYSNSASEDFMNLQKLAANGQYIRIEGADAVDTLISGLEADAKYYYIIRGFVETDDFGHPVFGVTRFSSIQEVQLADVAPEILSTEPNSASDPIMVVNDSIDFTMTFSKKVYRDPTVALNLVDGMTEEELPILTVRDSSKLVDGVHTFAFRLPVIYDGAYMLNFPEGAFVDADGLKTAALDVEFMTEGHPVTMLRPEFKPATNLRADKVTINWKKVSQADTMYLYYSTTKIGQNVNAPGIKVFKVPATKDNFTIFNLESETKYFFKLRAYSGTYFSLFSQDDSVTTLPIQHYSIANAINMVNDKPEHDGEIIRVKGIVTTNNMNPGSSGKDVPFYIQDPDGTSGGIYIFQKEPAADAAYTPVIGDTVIVTGQVALYSGAVQLSYIKEIVKVGNGPAVPSQTVTEINRDVLGELISIETLRYVKGTTAWFTDEASLGSGKTYKFTNGTDTFDIRFNRGFEVMTEPKADEVYTITGIGTIFKSSAPYTSGWQLTPRNKADFNRTSVIRPAQNVAAFRMYPNPVVDQVTIEVGANAKMVEIIDINGRVVFSQVDPNAKISVDFSQMRSGMYFVRVVNAKGATIQKLVK